MLYLQGNGEAILIILDKKIYEKELGKNMSLILVKEGLILFLYKGSFYPVFFLTLNIFSIYFKTIVCIKYVSFTRTIMIEKHWYSIYKERKMQCHLTAAQVITRGILFKGPRHGNMRH